MVEGICDKILAYSNSGIWSINCSLKPDDYDFCIRQHLHRAAKVTHKKLSINISCKKIDHLDFHQWREIQLPQYSRTIALWVSYKIFWNSAKRNLGVIYFILLMGS